MLAAEELRRHAAGRPTAITIGVFDGVHRGHRFLVDALRERAAARGLAAGIVTLHPSPVQVLRPNVRIAYLTSLEERIELLRATGVDAVAPLTFTSEVAELSAFDFLSMLHQSLDMHYLLMGLVSITTVGSFESVGAILVVALTTVCVGAFGIQRMSVLSDQAQAVYDDGAQPLDALRTLQANWWEMSTNTARANIPTLPATLGEAVQEMQADPLIREALGDHVFDRLVEAQTAEWDAFRKHVTGWERDRYLEVY